MLFSSRNYAIGMAHYQIAGGTVSLIGLGVAFIAVSLSIIGIVLYNTDAALLPRVMPAVFTLFLVIEAFVLVMLGGFRVGNCIRADISSNMIESHRQMPITAWRALAGYLLGTTAHVLVLSVLNMILLASLDHWAAMPFQNLVLSQIVLFAFAGFVWSFAALNSFLLRQIAPLIIFAAMFSGVASVFLRNFGILPGFSILISPFLGETIFNLTGGMVSLRDSYPIALSAQAAFSAVFFMSACRRYRGTYLTTFNFPQATALVAIWSLLSVAAIRTWPAIAAFFFQRFAQPGPRDQIVAALFVAAPVMIIPVHALSTWRTRRGLKMPLVLLGMAATVLAALLIVLADKPAPALWLLTAVVLATHVATIFTALRAFRLFKPMTTGILMAALVLTVWLIPLMIEGLLNTFSPADNPAAQAISSMIGAVSPLGLLIKMWTLPDSPSILISTLAIQAMVPLFFWRFGIFLARRSYRPAF